MNHLPKHLLEVSEDTGIRPWSIVRTVSRETLVLKLAVHSVPTRSSLCVIAFGAPVSDWFNASPQT